MKTLILSALASAFLLLPLPRFGGNSTGEFVYAQSNMETTYVKRNGSTIMVKVMAPAKVVDVKPYIKTKKGKEEGRLVLDVVIKNTASAPQSYAVFGQGKTENGGWLGGMSKVPKKGKLDSGQETTTEIRTRYEGKTVPEEIRIEVFSPQ